MKVIPAIDIIGGKCVRLTKGDYDRKTVYPDDPAMIAKSFESAGLTHLHVVDLDGAKAGRVVNLDVLRRICDATNLVVDFGGGVRSKSDLEKVFDAGVQLITGGSIAVRDRSEFETWLADFPGKIILGADVKEGKVAVSGWQELSSMDVFEFVDYYMDKGAKRIVCTEVERDGMMSGAAEELYQSLVEKFPEAEWVASGGIRHAEDLKKMNEIGMWGAIVGKAFHDGAMTLEELKACQSS